MADYPITQPKLQIETVLCPACVDTFTRLAWRPLVVSLRLEPSEGTFRFVVIAQCDACKSEWRGAVHMGEWAQGKGSEG